MGKDYIESRTVWASATLLISSVVTLALHFTGTSPIGPEMVGGALTGAISGLVFLVLRLVTKSPVGKKTEGNSTGANALIVFLLSLCLFGCSTIKAKTSVGIKIKKGPPCLIVIDVDGKRAVQVTGPKACAVNHGG